MNIRQLLLLLLIVCLAACATPEVPLPSQAPLELPLTNALPSEADGAAEPASGEAVEAAEAVDESESAEATEGEMEAESSNEASAPAADELTDSAEDASDDVAEDEAASEDAAEVAESTANGLDDDEPAVYVIQSGDSLGAIAEQLGVAVDALAAANGITNPDQISIGQTLVVPSDEGDVADVVVSAETEPQEAETETSEAAEDDAPEATATAESEDTVYVVQPGDALSLIAERNGILTASLAFANGLSVNAFLEVGQELVIPPDDSALLAASGVSSAEVTPPSAAATVYTVQAGDSLGSIAFNFGIEVDALAAANGILDYDAIYVGQDLVIP